MNLLTWNYVGRMKRRRSFIYFVLMISLLVSSCRRSPREIKTLPGAHVVFTDYRSILDTLDLMLENKNVDPEAYLEAAFIAYEYDDINSSRKFLDEYTQSGNNSARAFYLSSCLDLRQNQPSRAVSEGLQAYIKGLNDYRLMNVIATGFYRLKNYDSARWAVDMALDKYPSCPESLILKGNILLSTGDSTGALNLFAKGFSLDPESGDAVNAMISIYTGKGDWTSAMGLIKDKLAQNGTGSHMALRQELVDIFINLKRYYSADSLINVLPDQGNEYFKNFSKARLFYERYRLDSALFYADKAIQSTNEPRDAQVLEAKTLQRLSRYYDARNVYTSILEKDSTDVEVNNDLDHVNRIISYLNRINQFRQDSINRSRIKPLETIPFNKKP